MSQSFSYGCKTPSSGTKIIKVQSRGGEKRGRWWRESSSAGVHRAACLFSVLVTGCKRAVCAAHQRLQALCYSVTLIILKLPRFSSGKKKKINIIVMLVAGKEIFIRDLGSC